TVCGTWKVLSAADPAQNPCPAANTPGAGLMDPPPNDVGPGPNRYCSEVIWDLAALEAAGIVQPGRTYRMQFMFHDGDSTADVGENCVNMTVPGATYTPTVTPTPTDTPTTTPTPTATNTPTLTSTPTVTTTQT